MKNKKFIVYNILPITFDFLAVVSAWLLSFFLRFNFEIPQDFFYLMYKYLPLILSIHFFSFFIFGLYRGSWRFTSIIDLKRIFVSVALSTFLIGFIVFLISSNLSVPRSVLIINPILIILLLGGIRFCYRIFYENSITDFFKEPGSPILIIGQSTSVINILKDLSRSTKWNVMGILDDDKSMHGKEINGTRIFGGLDFLEIISKKLEINNVLIALPFSKYMERKLIITKAKELGLNVFVVPSVDEVISGNFTVSQIKRFEVEDLLGRDEVELDSFGLMSLLKNTSVLVSGAAGSIGSELCRQLLKFNPKKLICVDISEYALYQLEQELNKKKSNIKLLFIVGDIKNTHKLRRLIANHNISSVFHAAAYKHVPLMENNNVSEAFDNNIIGTFCLAKICKELNVEKFVLISTDKAVNPANIMGSSKRLEEMVCQGLQKNSKTNFIIVRFGNVLGSSGSVIPKFKEQINSGGPLTVTHPEITRYFMSIPEAAQLVLQASLMGNGGEIYLLDMGKPVKILDLAKDMIQLSGLSEDDIEIEFCGLRSGEKLYEELLANDENSVPTPHEKLRVAKANPVDIKWVNDLIKWVDTLKNKDEKVIKKELKMWLPEYNESNVEK